MNRELIQQMQSHFDSLANNLDDGTEFWFARDLQKPLGYATWQNFSRTIKRAIESCETAKIDSNDHFSAVTKMITLGKGGLREVDDLLLTRYACYLIAQNGDPQKEPIAFAQSYFAVQTRKLELIEDRMRLQARFEVRDRLRESEKTLSQNIYERGVDNAGFGRIRSKGDAALFGGYSTQEMKNRYGITQCRPLADFLPTLTIAAKNLATEMTNHNVLNDDLHGELPITSEHVLNNKSVRQMLGQRGIKPEELPPEEDIKKLERRVRSDEKRLEKQSGKLTEIGNYLGDR
ncbi:MAG: DNA damage-inducible protein D [Methanothrix sp.]